MRWLMQLLHLSRPAKATPAIPPQVKREAERVQEDWVRVRSVAEHSNRLRSTNGFIEALTRAQEGRK